MQLWEDNVLGFNILWITVGNSLNTGKNKQEYSYASSFSKFSCICNRETELNEPHNSKPGHRREFSPQSSSCFYFLTGLTRKHYGVQLSQPKISFKISSEKSFFLKQKISRTFSEHYIFKKQRIFFFFFLISRNTLLKQNNPVFRKVRHSILETKCGI